MKVVNYKDGRGRWYRVTLPDDSDDAEFGIVVGPPDVDELNLPEELGTRLNNQLYERGIITKADAKRKRGELIAVFQAALKTDAQRLYDLYRS